MQILDLRSLSLRLERLGDGIVDCERFERLDGPGESRGLNDLNESHSYERSQ